MKRLIFVRHGQTPSNVTKVLQGLNEPGLTKLGVEQAKKVAEALKDIDFHHIYASDFDRAKETAEKISEATGKNFILDERLREINAGSDAGRTHEDVDSERERLGVSIFDYIYNDGESWPLFQERVRKFFDEIAEKHDGEHVMFVSHGGVGRVLFSSLFGTPIGESHQYKHDNTGFSILEKDGDEWKIVKLNSTEHLE